MTSSPDDRRYSEEEIQAIFRRATERQESAGSTDPHHGLTLDELKEIGDESGIDPAHIEGAVSDLERGSLQEKPLSGLERFYGMSSSVAAERVLPGSMDDDTWEEGVEVLQSVFNTRGHAQTIGPIREWSAFTSSGFDYQTWQSDDTWYTLLEGLNLTSNKTQSPVHVEAKPEGDTTRITASYQMPPSRLWEAPGLLGGFWLAALATIVVYVVGSLPPTFLLVPAIFAFVGLCLGVYQRADHRSELQTTRERIEKATERLAYLHASKSQPEQQASASSETSASSDAKETSQVEWNTEEESASPDESHSRQRERS